MSLQNLDQILNLNIKIITILDQVIIGKICSYSPSNEIITVKLDQSKNIYKFINTSSIKSLQVLPPFPSKNPKRKQKDNKEDNEPNDFKVINLDNIINVTSNSVKNYHPIPIDHQKINETDTKKENSPVKQETPPAQTTKKHSRKESVTSKTNSTSTPTTKKKSNNPNILFDKLKKLYGEKNIKWSNQKHNEIVLFDEIKLLKPFTNSQKNIQLINKDSKKMESIQRALKQSWLEIDNEKRGG